MVIVFVLAGVAALAVLGGCTGMPGGGWCGTRRPGRGWSGGWARWFLPPGRC